MFNYLNVAMFSFSLPPHEIEVVEIRQGSFIAPDEKDNWTRGQ